MPKPEYDVVILGAGAAGLAAAGELARTGGHSVLILEARDRIGGRVWTHHEPDFPAPLELGAEFIHGQAQPVFDLLAAAGGMAVDANGKHATLQHGKPQPGTEGLFEEIQKSLKKAGGALRRKDIPFEEFLRRGARYGLSAEGCRYARMFVEGFDAADPARVSAASIAEEWSHGGMADSPQFRPAGGYATLLASMLRNPAGNSPRLQLQTVVHALHWRRDGVEVEARAHGREFRTTARRAVITLPLGVLQLPDGAPGAVRFNPPLDATKRRALQGLAAGPVLKVLLRFRSAFWESCLEGRHRNVMFFHSPGATFPTFWSALPLRVPLMVGWVGGPEAARLSNAKDAEIIQQSAAGLLALFNDPRIKGKSSRAVRGQLEGAWFHNWQQDLYARGAYSYVTVGNGKAREALAKPLLNTLFFAGEAADTEGEAGTVAGALQSGRRAAQFILKQD